MQLRSSFNKRNGFSQNCNSERDQLAELLPNNGCITECDSGSGRYSSAPNSVKHVQLSGDSASGESTNQREDTTLCRK